LRTKLAGFTKNITNKPSFDHWYPFVAVEGILLIVDDTLTPNAKYKREEI